MLYLLIGLVTALIAAIVTTRLNHTGRVMIDYEDIVVISVAFFIAWPLAIIVLFFMFAVKLMNRIWMESDK